MRMPPKYVSVLATVSLIVLGGAAQLEAHQEKSVDPTDFVDVLEVDHNNQEKRFPALRSQTNLRVDGRSVVSLRVDTSRIKLGLDDVLGEAFVTLRIEAFAYRRDAPPEQLAVPKYVSRSGGAESADTTVAFVYHDKTLSRTTVDRNLSTSVNLRPLRLQSGDMVELRITNLAIQTRASVYLQIERFGLRRQTSDSFLFVQRFLKSTDRELGFDQVKFLPTPGVTHHFQWYPRGSRFGQILHPGIGINVSFTDWKDPDRNPETGEFEPSTGTDVEVMPGLVLSVFDRLMGFTLGFNPNADRSKVYWGLGFSFVRAIQGVGEVGSP